MKPNSPPTKLEILVHSQQHETSQTPLLFVHGGFTSAWCWGEHYLPFFAAAGFAALAVSLSGHGGSRGREHLDTLSIDDYVSDLCEVVDALPVAPALIGHSMGGFVVQKYLEQRTAPAAVLMCSVPPQGLMSSAMELMLSRPSMLNDLNRIMAGSKNGMEPLRDAMFAQPISPDSMMRVYHHAQPESYRALWDMTLLNLPRLSHVTRTPLLVMGAALDQLIPRSSVETTARTYGVGAKIFPGMGHCLMLERDWRKPAECILSWLAQRGLMLQNGKRK
ncbi:MAG: alpha/beta hydrolase [Georgfuchsia sp.]